ncbi:FAD dependent oxidoreductase [Calycina marina]|uniref:FAD dependent oxidoreductase n=1 Tax=Calycina marina TaxID=1763456 RepID=A0A9P8CG55_9HELO|nr:FAD dependent oxidoreductase [Calycina marina]
MGEPIAIIGAGITGLAAAMVLSLDHKVTIIARDHPGDLGLAWASPWAGAIYHPQKDASASEQKMQRASFQYYWNLAHREDSSKSGVLILPMTEYFDDWTDEQSIWYRDLMPNYQILNKSELPENCTSGVKYASISMNPVLLLPYLMQKLEVRGVKFVRKEVMSYEEVRHLTGTRIVVNASGVGAKALGDLSVKPIRGQTMFVKTKFNELVMREGSEYTYVIPRAGSGGVIMGGIKSDRMDAEVDVELKSDILRRVNRITNNAFDEIDLETVSDIVAFRPGRDGGLRVERNGDVVHAYGAAGAGYIYSFGVAARVQELIEQTRARL